MNFRSAIDLFMHVDISIFRSNHADIGLILLLPFGIHNFMNTQSSAILM